MLIPFQLRSTRILLVPRCRYISSRSAKYLGASISTVIGYGQYRPRCFSNKTPERGVLGFRYRIFSSRSETRYSTTWSAHVFRRLTVKIRLRTLSRYLVLVGGVLFFHRLSPNWLARNLELRILDTAARGG